MWLCTKKRKMRRMTWINYGSGFEWSFEFSTVDLWRLVERFTRIWKFRLNFNRFMDRLLQLRRFLHRILLSFELSSHSKSFYVILCMKNWILNFLSYYILLNVNIMHTFFTSCVKI